MKAKPANGYVITQNNNPNKPSKPFNNPNFQTPFGVSKEFPPCRLEQKQLIDFFLFLFFFKKEWETFGDWIKRIHMREVSDWIKDSEIRVVSW